MQNLDWDDFASLFFGFAVVAILVGGYGAGLYLRRFLPTRHQTREGVEVIHVIIGMLVAMVAILLGLQLDAATKSFDDLEQLVDRYSIQIIQVDAILRNYGPEANEPREKLRAYTAAATASLLKGDGGNHHEQGEILRAVSLELLRLTPTNDVQVRVRSDALSLVNRMFEERWQIIAGGRLSPNLPLYAVLLFWFGLIYVSFGLNGTFNIPVFAVLTLSAFAVGGSIFVLADMNTPFGGLICVSPQPMQEALQRLDE